MRITSGRQRPRRLRFQSDTTSCTERSNGDQENQGAIYWSPATGAAPLTGAIYDAWATLGYERSALGLPTSAEIQEPDGSCRTSSTRLNLDRQSGVVVQVVDGTAVPLPPPPDGPPPQLERFSRARSRV